MDHILGGLSSSTVDGAVALAAPVTGGKIYGAISAVMAEISAIPKMQKNSQQGWKFRGIDDVYNVLQKTMAKHGVFSVPNVIEDRTEERKTNKGNNLIYRVLKIRYTFYADDGSNVSAVVIGEGMDSGDKAANKAMSIGDKYALLQVFKVATEDAAEPDHEVHSVADCFDYTNKAHQKGLVDYLEKNKVKDVIHEHVAMFLDGKVKSKKNIDMCIEKAKG